MWYVYVIRSPTPFDGDFPWHLYYQHNIYPYLISTVIMKLNFHKTNVFCSMFTISLVLYFRSDMAATTYPYLSCVYTRNIGDQQPICFHNGRIRPGSFFQLYLWQFICSSVYNKSAHMALLSQVIWKGPINLEINIVLYLILSDSVANYEKY